MKQLMLAGLVAGLALACAESTSVLVPPAGPRAHFDEEGPQSAPEEVPAEYNIPTSISVGAGGGFEEIASGNMAYGQSVVNYTGTNGLAKATLEIAGYADAHGEKQVSGFLPLSGSVDVYAIRNISETCGKSSRTEAYGEAWNEYISATVLSWGKKKDSDTYTAMLEACPTRRSGEEGIDHCDWYQLEISYDDGDTWVENGDSQWLCPGDEPEWELKNGRNIDLTHPTAVTTGRASERPPVRTKQARILFVGTHYLEVNAHALVQSGTKFGVDAVVIVDTMRASPDDIEAAILAAAYHVNTAPLSESQRIAVAKSGLRLKGPAKARAAERANPILKATKQAHGRVTAYGWTGRAFRTTVDLPTVISAKDSQ
jgi:hypothetical protein